MRIQAFGVAVLIDCHSMPRLARSGDRLGARHRAGRPLRHHLRRARIVDLAEMVFTGAGPRVARNRPYAGGFVAAPTAGRSMASTPCRSRSAGTST